MHTHVTAKTNATREIQPPKTNLVCANTAAGRRRGNTVAGQRRGNTVAGRRRGRRGRRTMSQSRKYGRQYESRIAEILPRANAAGNPDDVTAAAKMWGGAPLRPALQGNSREGFWVSHQIH